MSDLFHGSFRPYRAEAATDQRCPSGIDNPLRPHRIGEVGTNAAGISGSHRRQKRRRLAEKYILLARHPRQVAELNDRSQPEIPTLERELPAWREDAKPDLLFLCDATAEHRPESSILESQQNRDRGIPCSVLCQRLRKSAHLGNFTDQIARQIDQMRALLVQLPTRKGGICPPGHPVGCAHPMPNKTEHCFGLEEIADPLDRS